MSHERMSANDILTLVFDRDTAVNTLWTVYIAVVAGLATLIAADRPLLRTAAGRWSAIVFFALFAASNVWAMCQPQRQRTILLAMLPEDDPGLKKLKHDFPSLPTWQLVTYHVGFDIAIALAIWFIPPR
jgi:hypothetical protein